MNDDAVNVLFFDPLPSREALETLCTGERDILDEINRRAAAAESLEELMDFLFERTRDICPCDRIGIAFTEEGGTRMTARWVRALYEPVLLREGYTRDVRGSSLERVVQSGQLRIIRDLARYLEEKPESHATRLLLREGVRSNMTCPLSVEGRPVGVLFRSSRKPNVYDRHVAQLHFAVAERLGQAVEKAHRIKQLADANAAYTEMLGFVSHELKSPVASMVADAQLFTGGYLGELNDLQRERAERIATNGQRLLAMVGDYLNLANIERGDLRAEFKEQVDFVAEAIVPALESLAAPLEQSGATLERRFPSKPVLLRCDPTLMKIVMVNLIGNAIKYGSRGGVLRIALSVRDANLRVSVWNEGPGFPGSEQSRLFRKFSRLKSPELAKRKGTGVGLYTCWKIVQLHGGRIWAESEHGKWAEFSFEVPLAGPRSRED